MIREVGDYRERGGGGGKGREGEADSPGFNLD